MSTYKWDVFISHASEDKAEVVLPLAELLQQAGFKVWLDEHELKPGYSLREQIDHGLANSQFGIMVVSKAFMQKPWPRAEMNAILSSDIAGRIRLIPVWHEVTFNEVLDFSPLLADRFALRTSEDMQHVVSDLIRVMLQEQTESLTATKLFLDVLGDKPNSRRVTEFLLAHPNILNRANHGRYWCSARDVLGLDDIPETEDYILGGRLFGTEDVWLIYTIFFLPTDQPICDANGQEIQELQRCAQWMQEVSRMEPYGLTDSILAQHSLSREKLFYRASSNCELGPPLLVTRRRTELHEEELAFIRRRNQSHAWRIHTFDWLIDACRSLDYG